MPQCVSPIKFKILARVLLYTLNLCYETFCDVYIIFEQSHYVGILHNSPSFYSPRNETKLKKL